MGCGPSAEKERDANVKETAGKITAYKPRENRKSHEFNSTKDADPRLQLSVREVYAVTRSWKAISRNMNDTGVTMFMSLFEQNADFMGLFKQLSDVEDTTELRGNKIMKRHALTVMFTLDEAVCNLDDLDYVTDILHKTGAYHVNFPDYTSENFGKMQKPFLLAVKDTLGDRYNASLQHSYEVVIQFILNALAEGFDTRKADLKQQALPKANGNEDGVVAKQAN